MDEAERKYRQHLVDTLQRVSESYDKTVITLSSGALGISFAFLSDYLGKGNIATPELLLWGWVFLVASLGSVLLSLFFGTFAFKKAIKQVDDGSIRNNRPGGVLGALTLYLHSSGALFLLLGLVLVGMFFFNNIGENSNGAETDAATTTTSTGPRTPG